MFKFLLLSLTLCISLYAHEQLPFYKETEHFKLYCMRGDQQASDEVLQVLENNYPRIACDFEDEISERINIEIYPNIEIFHEKMGCVESGDWFIARANEKDLPDLNRGIYMVSLNNPGPVHDKESMLIASVHEMTHFFVFKKATSDLPLWMHEGIACYEAGQFNTKSLNHMLHVVSHNGIPSLELLSKYNSEVFCNAGGYAFSYTLIKFIVQKWSFKTLLKLVQDYGNFEDIMGISFEEFESDWRKFISQHYLSKPFNYDVKNL
ncbi:MAG: peptidase MA family metallohydrolase [Candidatus Thorarchaeota archaeon]